MVGRNLVASKLSELADHPARVRARRKGTADELRRDRDTGLADLEAFSGEVATWTTRR